MATNNPYSIMKYFYFFLSFAVVLIPAGKTIESPCIFFAGIFAALMAVITIYGVLTNEE